MRHYNLKRNIKSGGVNGGLRGRPPRRGGAWKTRLGRDKGEARSKTVKGTPRQRTSSLTWLSRRVLRKQRGLDNKGAAGAETRGIPPPPFLDERAGLQAYRRKTKEKSLQNMPFF